MPEMAGKKYRYPHFRAGNGANVLDGRELSEEKYVCKFFG
jgi:hypothetical protein